MDVIWLRVMVDIPHKEAARTLGCSYQTVFNARFGVTWYHLRWPDPWIHEVIDGKTSIYNHLRPHPGLMPEEDKARLAEQGKVAEDLMKDKFASGELSEADLKGITGR